MQLWESKPKEQTITSVAQKLLQSRECSVADSDPYVLGLLDPDPDPVVRCTDLDPDPSIIK